MYIKIINGKPEIYSMSQLRLDNKNVSFPSSIPDDLLAQYGVYKVHEGIRPIIDESTHYLKQTEFYQVDGKWYVHYVEEFLPAPQVEAGVRQKRNMLLTDSDWIIVKSYETNSDVPSEWLKYRQSLRDVPNQENFPYVVEWPQPPQ